MFTAVPNQVRLDVTERLRPAGETNVLTVYVDRHYVGLWMGHLSISDHSEIALGASRLLVYRASAPAGEPVFVGISDADLYFRTPQALPVYAGAPDWFAAAAPATMGRLGPCILMPPAPADVDGPWNGEKLARAWSSILTELNVGLAEGARLFVPVRVAPYAVKPDPYDGDAFHNW